VLLANVFWCEEMISVRTLVVHRLKFRACVAVASELPASQGARQGATDSRSG